MIPKILFKYPSRGREKRFFEGLDSIVDNLYDKDNYEILVAIDIDDRTMNRADVINRIESYKNVSINWGYSKSKVAAVNRGLNKETRADIIAVHSDDMRWQFYGFDQIIRQQFEDEDFDKLIHIMDQDAKQALATYFIAGIDYFKRFGYVYNNQFKSLWCDNLVQDIAKLLGKYHFVDIPGLLLHLNPCYGHYEKDPMFLEQQGHWTEDEAKYYEIKERGYDLHLYK